MPHDRFFVSFPLAYKEDHEAIIEDDAELHHLRTVMKCREGDTIELIDGKGWLGHATITQMMKKSCKLHIETLSSQDLPRHRVTVAIAVTRPSHLEFAIEKCVEVGASSFLIFKGDYSERQTFSESTQKRMHLIVQSALKQSGRLHLPSITLIHSLDEAILKAPKPLFYGDISPLSKSINEFRWDKTEKTYLESSIFIGPERGWSEREKSHLKEVSPHGGIILSDAVLRAETAAIIGCHMVKQAMETALA